MGRQKPIYQGRNIKDIPPIGIAIQQIASEAGLKPDRSYNMQRQLYRRLTKNDLGSIYRGEKWQNIFLLRSISEGEYGVPIPEETQPYKTFERRTTMIPYIHSVREEVEI